MNVKRGGLAHSDQKSETRDQRIGAGRKEEGKPELGSSESQEMVAWNVCRVNKIIIRYRSNGERREVAESQQVAADSFQKLWDQSGLVGEEPTTQVLNTGT